MKKITLFLSTLLLIVPIGVTQASTLKAKGKAANLVTQSQLVKSRIAATPMNSDEPTNTFEGELKTILTEDFSKFPTGTIESPTAVPVDGWGYLQNAYTTYPDWYGEDVYAADGACLLELNAEQITGYICTPDLAFPYGGSATMRVKLLGDESVTDVFMVEYNDSDFGDNISFSQTELVGGNWVDINIPIIAYNYNTYLCFYVQTEKVLIDDIEVKAMMPYILPPASLSFSNYTGTSFTANWSTVEEATSYLLSVYSEETAGSPIYLFEDKEVTGTSYTVTGIEEGKAYYFSVKAKNAEHTSAASAVVKMAALITPVFEEPIVSGTNFTINWNDIEGATNYDFWAYRAITVDEENFSNPVELINQDFSAISSTGTIDTPENKDGELYNYVPCIPGWILWGASYIDGAIGINTPAIDDGMLAYLETPLYDLSMTDGSITIEADFATDAPSDGGVGVYLANETPDEILMDDGKIIETLSKEWTHHTFTLNGTTAATKLVFSPLGTGRVFIDNIKITVTADMGKTVLVPIVNATGDINSAIVPMDGVTPQYACKVRCMGPPSDGMGLIYSSFTDLKYVTDPTSIETILPNKSRIILIEGVLQIENPSDAEITVYNSNGVLIATALGTSVSIELPQRGVYIVKVGNEVTKVIR